MPDTPGPEEVPFARVWDASAAEPTPPIEPPGMEPPPMEPPPIPPAIPPASPPAYQQSYGAYSNYTGANYGYTARVGKPGLISTLGVLSIVFASFSMIGSGVTALQAMVMPVITRAINATSAINAAKLAKVANANQAIAAGPLGLPLADRQTAVNVIAARQFLTPARLAQLDGLLADDGQIILGVEPGGFTSNDVRAVIKSTSRGKSASGMPGPDVIVTLSGAIELYDANGVFRPDDHSRPVVRVAADTNKYLRSATADALAQPPIFPGAAPVTSGGGGPAAGPISAPVAPALDLTAVTLVVVESGVSLLLAVYLLVAGILTVRSSPRGRLMHLIYLVIKVPLVVLAAYAGLRLSESFNQSMSLRPAAARPPVVLGGGVWISVFFASLYLVALGILLFTPTVREYYRKSPTSSGAR